jgi:hypothetical protein
MQLLKGSGLTRLLSHSGCNDAALWIVWSVERTTGAAGVDLCAVAAIHAHDIKTKVAIPGARVLAVSRKPNRLRSTQPWAVPNDWEVITLEDWALIRRLHVSEKLPKAQIARQLAISRNTVATKDPTLRAK